ncbi:MAG: 30S ribosomal protein S20 [Bacteroidales bacterium]|nr:30S ribosomal protein S20 [Bacteroidales bacterium]
MAHHHSAKKRIRQDEAIRLRNRYYAVTMRNAVRKLRANNNKEEAVKALPVVVKMIDKLAKRNVIHKNKASNLKSKLQLHVNKLA